MEEHFASLTEAITSVFRREETSLLTLDRICQALQAPGLFLSTSGGIVPCSTISRRRISSILSSCDIFVRAGPPRSGQWALRPSNPLFLSDGAITSCINQILAEHGPLTVDAVLERGDFTGATGEIISQFLASHPNDYVQHDAGRWWFAGQPLPQKMEFESVISAILRAFEILQRDASIEEIAWLLSLSTLPQNKKISRRKISRELSRRPDIFQHISRAKYALIKNKQKQQKQPIQNKLNIPLPNNVSGFQNVQQQQCFFELMNEVPPKFDFNCDWMTPINQCETPPLCTNDFFDPNEFFSIGFSESF